MNWRVRNKLIEQICLGNTLFIKDTGVRVFVDYFGSDFDGLRSSRFDLCKVIFHDKPTHKALKQMRRFHIRRNSHSKAVDVDGEITIDKLSLTPYESKGAKVLYEKKK